MRHRHLLLATLLLIATPLAASDLWLHLTVEETGWDHQSVRMNLPLSVVREAAPLIPKSLCRHCSIRVDGHDLDVRDLQRAVAALGENPGNEPIRVDRDLLVSRRGDRIVITRDHGWDRSTTTEVPIDLAQALFSSGERIDPGALVRALASRGQGEILLVNDRDAVVRIWIDDRPEAPRGERP